MKESLKELCFFMICGQTLLFFQSGKKYEKICRMILELLILVGIAGMILSFLQSLGFRKGEITAAGGAVENMRHSMEEALNRQLGGTEETDIREDNFLWEESMEELLETYTLEEIKSKYNYLAERYGAKMEKIERTEEKIRVFLKEEKTGETDGDMENEEAENERNPAKNTEIEKIKIGEIRIGQETAEKEKQQEEDAISFQKEAFREEFARALSIDEENLEVVLID